MHVPEPFPQLIGRAEHEMTDLIQILDPHVAARAAHDQQRADRFDITIRGFRDPPSAARQRRAGRFDRVELIGLAVAAPFLTVGTVDLDHDQAPAAQMTRQPGTTRAGPFHTDSGHVTEIGEPTMQLGITGRCRRDRFNTQHTVVRVDRGRNMHIRVRVNSARDRARGLYDGHRHPFSLKRSRGGTRVQGRRP
jgi:hypothetical protein